MNNIQLSDNDLKQFIDYELNRIEPILKTVGAEVDRRGIYPDEILQYLKESRLLSLLIPKEFGGIEGAISDVLFLIERVSGYCASTATILMFHYQVVQRLLDFGSKDQKKTYFKKIAEGMVCASAWTEPNSGANKHGLSAQLKRIESGFVLNGEKSFCTSAGKADIYTVLVKNEETQDITKSSFGLSNQSFVIIELKDKGIRFGEPWNGMGMRGTSTGEIFFENCIIPKNRIIGNLGDGTKIMKANRESAIHPGVVGLGISARAFSLAYKYANERRLTSHQAIRFYLSEMKIDYEASKLVIYKAAKFADSGINTEAGLYSMISKVLLAQNSVSITSKALQIFGGKGYLKQHNIERLYRDARALALMGPTTELSKEIIFNDLGELE